MEQQSYLTQEKIGKLLFSAMLTAANQGGSNMEKFIPYEKLSKKEKRTTWGDLNPVTRKPANSGNSNE